MIYSIPPRNYPGKDHVAIWEGFLTEDEINLILAQPEWLEMAPGYIGGPNDSGVVDNKVRSSKVCWLGAKPELLPIWDKFANVVAEINRRYFHLDLTGFHEPIQLALYSENDNGHYDWHIDMNVSEGQVPRKLSIAMLLSDRSEFEGGDFEVKTVSDEVQTLETKKGRAWFFPSYTLHRVTPVTKGIRRSLVLWVGGPPFK